MNEEAAHEPQVGHEPPVANKPPWAHGAGAAGEDTPHSTAPPSNTPPSTAPPFTAGPTFSREHLVRPRQGRYVAGVCGALARATNTDPVLWRVLLAVLGVLSGVGVLFYLIGWLTIPSEGDTASPIESLLGKGRSTMAPLSVLILGVATVLTFTFVVHDGTRAGILVAAVALGAVLLIKRGSSGSSGSPASGPVPPGPHSSGSGFGTPSFGTPSFGTPGFGTPGSGAPGSGTPGFGAPGFGTPGSAPAGFSQAGTTPSGFAPSGNVASGSVPSGSAPPFAAEEPVTSPNFTAPSFTAPAYPPPPPYSTAPAGGYRPPFAPHGPYAPSQPYPPYQQPPVVPPKAPKPPRERSALGRLTFFAVVVVIGVMAVIDMAGASIPISGYFAAALVTVALGLIVGTWLGRARGLIALALLISLGLGLSTGAERWGGVLDNGVYRPTSVATVADRYDFTAGQATLDLRNVDFTGKQSNVTVTMKIGQLKILLPPNVDTTATVRLKNGRAVILGKEFSEQNIDGQTVTDLGADGTGGGTLKLDLQLDTGNLEVTR